jgi:hypothetical protein
VSNRLQITTYFRCQFVITNAAAYSNLTLRLVRDDGAVIYLNGTELWRDNMPAGAISYTTPAIAVVSVPDESAWWTRTTNAAALVNGTNIIAVEVHQQSTASSDVSFNFELVAAAGLSPARLSAGLSTNQLQLTWPAWAAGLTLMAAPDLTAPVTWTPATNTAALSNNQWRVTLPVATNGSRFYRLQAP